MSRFVYILYLFLPLMFFLPACNDEPSCKRNYVLTVKAIDHSGKDITDTRVAGEANLYIFDQNKRYLDMITVPEDDIINRNPIDIVSYGMDNIWVVVWSNLNGNQDVSELSSGMNMNEAFVTLLRDSENNAISPDDIFFGIKNISTKFRDTASGSAEIIIARMTARIKITVKGLDPAYVDEYKLLISDARADAYNFEGSLAGSSVDYLRTGEFDPSNIYYSTPQPILILPVKQGNRLKISIYKGEQLIASTLTDDEGIPITPPAGTTENIFIDLNPPVNDMSVKIEVTDWDKVYNWMVW